MKLLKQIYEGEDFIDDSLCYDKINKYILQHPNFRRKLINKTFNQEQSKKFILAVTKEIDEVYGLYRKGDLEKISANLNNLKTQLKTKTFKQSLSIHKKILSLNPSTKARIPNYSRIYKEIFKRTGKPNSILDLACGLNPISLIYMNLPKVNYLASDIKQSDVKILNNYFKTIQEKTKIKGKAIKLDLEKEIPKAKADICLMFELIDIIPLKNTKRLIKQINCQKIVVTFPYKTIKPSTSRYKRFSEFQKYLKKQNIKNESFTCGKEIIYIISKSI